MTIHMRPYAGAADLQRILDLKRTCTTPENIYDTPIFSELLALLAPLPQDPAAGRPPWEDEQGRAIGHHHRRALAQQATMLWEENDDRLLAYALVAPPSTVLTFQVHHKHATVDLRPRFSPGPLQERKSRRDDAGEHSRSGAACTSTKRDAARSWRRPVSRRFRREICAWFARSISPYLRRSCQRALSCVVACMGRNWNRTRSSTRQYSTGSAWGWTTTSPPPTNPTWT